MYRFITSQSGRTGRRVSSVPPPGRFFLKKSPVQESNDEEKAYTGRAPPTMSSPTTDPAYQGSLRTIPYTGF